MAFSTIFSAPLSFSNLVLPPSSSTLYLHHGADFRHPTSTAGMSLFSQKPIFQQLPVKGDSRSFGLIAPVKVSTNKSEALIREEEKEGVEENEDEGEQSEEWKVGSRATEKRAELRLPERWREIQGSSNWEGMLDPLDPLLRTELIRYGEMAQACYDGFDSDQFSKYCGSCKYNRRHFLEGVGLPESGYDVTRYLYAVSNVNLPNFFKKSVWPEIWSSRANWMGYVAVSKDSTTLGRRDIMVAWRGTVTQLEWVADLMDFLQSVRLPGHTNQNPQIKVESGFLDLYTDKDPACRFCLFSAREQILTEIKRLVDQCSGSGEDMSIGLGLELHH